MLKVVLAYLVSARRKNHDDVNVDQDWHRGTLFSGSPSEEHDNYCSKKVDANDCLFNHTL